MTAIVDGANEQLEPLMTQYANLVDAKSFDGLEALAAQIETIVFQTISAIRADTEEFTAIVTPLLDELRAENLLDKMSEIYLKDNIPHPPRKLQLRVNLIIHQLRFNRRIYKG